MEFIPITEITFTAFKHIKQNHMLGYSRSTEKSQFNPNPTRAQLLEHCLKLTDKHLDPLHDGGPVRCYFLRTEHVARWAPVQRETDFLRFATRGRSVISIYPIVPSLRKLQILEARGVA